MMTIGAGVSINNRQSYFIHTSVELIKLFVYGMIINYIFSMHFMYTVTSVLCLLFAHVQRYMPTKKKILFLTYKIYHLNIIYNVFTVANSS